MSKQEIFRYAVACVDKKEYSKAIDLFRALPQTDEIIFNIATCHKDTGDINNMMISKDMFAELLRKKTKIPNLAEATKVNYLSAITTISNFHLKRNELDKAIGVSKEGLKLLKNNPVIIYNIGHIYKCAGNHSEAKKYLYQAMELEPTHRDTYIELINIYRDLKDDKNLTEIIQTSLKALPNDPYLYNELGISICDPSAFDAFNKALDYGKDDKILLSKVQTNIGHLMSLYGNIKESIERYQLAFNTNPKDMISRQNYLMDLLYLENSDFNNTLRQHFIQGAIVHQSYHVRDDPNGGNHQNAKIHLGYVSSDFFGTHPMVHFLKCLLNDFNQNEFEIFCYSNAPLENDHPYSKLIHWRNLEYTTPANCINIILNDKIDVLIDLSGHTSGNRMDIFSNRLAKLQLNYLGYPCITGMPCIDYYIIDGTFNFIGSRIMRMKHCFTNYVPPFIPTKLEQPYHEKKYITFGSLNKAGKINLAVIKLWNRVLNEIPDSKLIIKPLMNDKMIFDHLENIIIVDRQDNYQKYVEQYNLIDISLDTFPYAGTTTTCESLLMGTPVVSLADRKTLTIHQNTTASLLINSGLSHLVASSEDEYICIIKKLVEQIKEGKNLKQDIQKAFLNGNVTNRKLYIQDFETMIKSKLIKN